MGGIDFTTDAGLLFELELDLKLELEVVCNGGLEIGDLENEVVLFVVVVDDLGVIERGDLETKDDEAGLEELGVDLGVMIIELLCVDLFVIEDEEFFKVEDGFCKLDCEDGIGFQFEVLGFINVF